MFRRNVESLDKGAQRVCAPLFLKKISMDKYLYVVLLALVILSSCQHGSRNYDHLGISDHYQSDNPKKIDLSDLEVGSAALYSEYFISVKYVPLEATSNSLVGEISKLMVSKSGEYIVFCDRDKSIIRFSSEGKYLNNIGLVGHGAKEYEWPTCVAYDEFRDQVIVYDCAKQDLMYYEIDGTFLNKIHLPKAISSFEVIDENHMVLNLNYRGEYPNVHDLYNYVIVDHKGNISGYHAPYDEDRKGLSMTGFLSRSEGHTYCMVNETPLINEITRDSLVTKYYADYGKFRFPEEMYEKSYEEFVEFRFNKPKDIACNLGFYKTGKNLFLSFSWNGDRTHLMIANEDSLQHPTYMCELDNDMYGLVSSIDILYASCGKVFFLLQPEDFEFRANNTQVNQDLMANCVVRNKETSKAVENQDDELAKTLWNLSERYAKRGGSLIFTPEEKKEMLRLSMNNNPVIQVCTLK